MPTTGILSLGTRSDATTWENGCRGLGFSAPSPIKTGQPTMEQLEAFFRTTPDWIYFGGHFSGDELYNEADDVKVRFYADKVKLSVRNEEKEILKSSGDFRLNENVTTIVWGGCSVAGNKDDVIMMRSLFDAHVTLGFSGLVGIAMYNAMFGKDAADPSKFFFGRVADHINDTDGITSAWMETGKYYYGGGDYERKPRAWDNDGQEWEIISNQIRSGRKI